MVETKNPEEPTLASKRKSDVSCEENEEHPNKSQKLQSSNNDSQLSEDKTQDPDEKCVSSDAKLDNNDKDDDNDNEDGNAEVVVDRKGKGILMEDDDGDDDRSSDDDDDNLSDGGSQSDGESDLSDDPLAEVDLDNILPSRTRRRVIRPGEFIASDLADDDDDSDSDDDDA